MKLQKCVFQRKASTLDVAMVTKGGRRLLKNRFCIEN